MTATRYSSRYIQKIGLIEVICNYKKRVAPRVGLEPTTLRLTAECSTIELPRNTVSRLDAGGPITAAAIVIHADTNL